MQYTIPDINFVQVTGESLIEQGLLQELIGENYDVFIENEKPKLSAEYMGRATEKIKHDSEEKAYNFLLYLRADTKEAAKDEKFYVATTASRIAELLKDSKSHGIYVTEELYKKRTDGIGNQTTKAEIITGTLINNTPSQNLELYYSFPSDSNEEDKIKEMALSLFKEGINVYARNKEGTIIKIVQGSSLKYFDKKDLYVSRIIFNFKNDGIELTTEPTTTEPTLQDFEELLEKIKAAKAEDIAANLSSTNLQDTEVTLVGDKSTLVDNKSK